MILLPPWLCVALTSHVPFKMMRPLCSPSYLFHFLASLSSNFNRNPETSASPKPDHFLLLLLFVFQD